MENKPFRKWQTIKTYPWKVLAKYAIQRAEHMKLYLYATDAQFVGYEEKLTDEEQLKIKAHLIYQPHENNL